MSQTSFFSDLTPQLPQSLIAKAKALPKARVAIASAGAELPMQAAQEATHLGLMEPVFVGQSDEIKAQAAALNWDISGFEIIPAEGETEAGMRAAKLCGDGQADVLMKGHLHTDVFMKAALNRENKLRTDQRLVHIFHMSAPDTERPLLISDAAVNVAPDITTRQEAIRHCTDMMTRLGQPEPKIALLSATETPIPAVPSSLEAQELATWAATALPQATVSGPLAMDLILSRQAAQTKGLSDVVAGDADAIIVPDIVSGNALFKTLVYGMGGCAAGIVMGAAVPILLTSRADPAQARIASVALASVMR